MRIERRQFAAHLSGVRFDLAKFLCADLALEFEPSQIAEQRPFLGCQSIGFIVERAQSIGRASCQGFGLRAFRLLSAQSATGDDDQKCRSAVTMACHLMFEGTYDNSIGIMRVLAIDVGQRRIGLAISDISRTLARPLETLTVIPSQAVDRVAHEIARLAAEDDGLSQVIVGLPVRLDGTPNEQTASVTTFIDALRTRIDIPIETEDERLTSREAESRLAVSERDWRKRKARLDAAAAAVILQDYLDRQR